MNIITDEMLTAIKTGGNTLKPIEISQHSVKLHLFQTLTKANIFTRVTFNTPAKPRPTSVGMLKSCGFFYAWRNQA